MAQAEQTPDLFAEIQQEVEEPGMETALDEAAMEEAALMDSPSLSLQS